MLSMHKVFISYHHENDQIYKDALASWNNSARQFIDMSVDTGDIDDSLSDEGIRVKIRDEYLKDSTVTVVLVGTETKCRKHVDWEIYSSMYDGPVNKKSGIIAVLLPSVTGGRHRVVAGHGIEEQNLYPSSYTWEPVTTKDAFSWGGFHFLPERIVDNILRPEARISVTTWNDIANDTSLLVKLIDLANADRANCQYDLSRIMKRRNS